MPYIDKSNYLRELQCPKLLWHSLNRREAIPAPDASAQAVFEQGRKVGVLSQQLFPGGIDLSQSPSELHRAVALAQKALQITIAQKLARTAGERAAPQFHWIPI